jgi:hypothetical protein
MQGAKRETLERCYVIRGRLQNETRTNTGTQQQSDGIVLQSNFLDSGLKDTILKYGFKIYRT